MKPHLIDDGSRPELDLHGCTVDEALFLTRQLIDVSVQYGRNSIKIIHGKSTTTNRGERTIKSALTGLVDSGDLNDAVNGAYKLDGYMLISLRRSGTQHSTGRITMDMIDPR